MPPHENNHEKTSHQKVTIKKPNWTFVMIFMMIFVMIFFSIELRRSSPSAPRSRGRAATPGWTPPRRRPPPRTRKRHGYSHATSLFPLLILMLQPDASWIFVYDPTALRAQIVKTAQLGSFGNLGRNASRIKDKASMRSFSQLRTNFYSLNANLTRLLCS